MRKNARSWAGLTAALAMTSIVSAACNGGGGGGDPTPTPSQLDIAVTDYYTLGGAAGALYGECAGFTVTPGTGATFADDVELYLTDGTQDITIPLTADDGFISVAADGSSFTLGGDPTAEPYPCITFPINPNNWPASMGIRVVNGTSEDSLDAVLTFTEPTYATLADGAGTASGNWSQTADFDTFSFTGGLGQFSAVRILTATSGQLPVSSIWADDFSELYDGYDVVLASTVDGNPYKLVTREGNFGTGTFTATLTSSGTLTAVQGDDTCNNAGTALTAGTYHLLVDLQNAANAGDYNPAGSQACTDRLITPTTTSGVKAPGKDTTFLVTLADGETIWVGAGGPTTDVSLYLLPASAACAPQPTNCVAAADIFGPMNGGTTQNDYSGTDSMKFTNNTGGALNYHLVVDDFGDGSAGNPTGTGNVYLFVHIE